MHHHSRQLTELAKLISNHLHDNGILTTKQSDHLPLDSGNLFYYEPNDVVIAPYTFITHTSHSVQLVQQNTTRNDVIEIPLDDPEMLDKVLEWAKKWWSYGPSSTI